MSINLDSWGIIGLDKESYFKEVEVSDLFTETKTFKIGNISKEITGLEDDLILISSTNETVFSKVFFYQLNGKMYALKINKDTKHSLEGEIYFFIFNLQKIINSESLGSQYKVLFAPDLLKCLYLDFSDPESIELQHHHFIINEKMNDCLEYIDKNRNLQSLISLLYIISAKIIFLQKNIEFNHNDLKLENIVWFYNNGAIDFNFIDFGFSRIKPRNYISSYNKQYGAIDQFIDGKDIYCLIHNIFYYLRLKGYESLTKEFNQFVSGLDLAINNDYTEPKQFIQMSEKLRKEYHYKYDISLLPETSVPFFLAYKLNSYPEQYNTLTVFTKIEAFIRQSQLIDTSTYNLGLNYISIGRKFSIDKPGQSLQTKYLIDYQRL